MKDVWKIKPTANFAYTIGYPEHKSDVLYYERIKKLSEDKRFEWMEARRNCGFTGPKGEQTPTACSETKSCTGSSSIGSRFRFDQRRTAREEGKVLWANHVVRARLRNRIALHTDSISDRSSAAIRLPVLYIAE